ncbi:MAG: glutamate 5-kinase [Candidatus Verstraetearchaeota archaeon]|nr:glutamate 5-kinase [Candidatus Verstraetearchaeota archaeon]
MEKQQNEERMLRTQLGKSKLVVVKVGASSLSDDQGNLDLNKINSICVEISGLMRRGKSVVLVSSGAIKAGKAIMSDTLKNGELPSLQAFAAIGQVLLMESYRDIMAGKGYRVAQILLTWDDFRNKTRLKNLINTLRTLIDHGVLPIINENDTIAVEEIKFGDNDTLSALVAVHLKADLLIILSDIDGLYTGDPSNPSSKIISYVPEVTSEIEALASSKHKGFGGMKTKLKAAKLVSASGIPMVIAKGDSGVLERIISGDAVGTIFGVGGQKCQ